MSKSYSGLIPEGRLLLAFSGGEDSLFLLYLLSLYAKGRSVALYVNHAIRPEEELRREENLNCANAGRLGIPLVIVRLEPGAVEKSGEGTEDGARKLRYEALLGYARENGFDHVLTAHHRDDQAETVLMRILSGAPFYAWGGIREEDGLIARPLLKVPKEEIHKEVERLGLVASQDSTNSDRSYLRNSIRHGLLPLFDGDSKDLLSRIGDNVNALRRRCPPLDGGPLFYKRFPREEIMKAGPVTLERTVYSLSPSGERVSRSFISGIREGAERGSGKAEGHGLHIRFTQSEVFFYPLIDDFVLELGPEDTVFQGLRACHEAEDSKTLLFDVSLFKPPVILRTSRPGDYIRLKGSSKRVKDMERDWKVPYSLVVEDREGIAAVMARFLGASDRLSSRFLGIPEDPAALAICPL